MFLVNHVAVIFGVVYSSDPGIPLEMFQNGFSVIRESYGPRFSQ